MLQSRLVIRASDIAKRFDVSLRTVYRDIGTLYEAGVPICGDAGIGYSLIEGYRLPPLMFTQAEALAFVTAGKFVEQLTDTENSKHFNSGMDKIRSVLKSVAKCSLENLDNSIEVYRNKLLPASKHQNLLQAIMESISSQTILHMKYYTPSREASAERDVEIVGITFIHPYWYLVAWCHLRQDYRNFRIDRIEELSKTRNKFTKKHPPLQELGYDCDDVQLTKVVMHTTKETAKYMGYQKYNFGLVSEKEIGGVIEQVYMCHYTESISRWALAYIDTTKVVEPLEVSERIEQILSRRLDYGT